MFVKTATQADGKTLGKVAILVSLYHEDVTGGLLEGAQRALRAAGVADENVDVYSVPGAFELSQAAHALASTGTYSAIVPLGCLLRGETVHFDVIARAVATGLDATARETGVAISFGILTPDTKEQAFERAGGALGNKGEEAAQAALSMAAFRKELTPRAKSTKSA